MGSFRIQARQPGYGFHEPWRFPRSVLPRARLVFRLPRVVLHSEHAGNGNSSTRGFREIRLSGITDDTERGKNPKQSQLHFPAGKKLSEGGRKEKRETAYFSYEFLFEEGKNSGGIIRLFALGRTRIHFLRKNLKFVKIYSP